MRMAAVVFLGGLTLLLVPGCSDDDAGAGVSDRLSAFLLQDEDVATVLPDLEAKSDYSTEEDYGVVREADLVGPTESAVAGVVRQWSQDSSQATDGEAWTLVSSVLEFPSAAEAESAAEAVLELVGTDPVEVGVAFVALTEPQEGLSSAVVLVTRDALMVTVEIGYVGTGDQQEAGILAEKVAARLG